MTTPLPRLHIALFLALTALAVLVATSTASAGVTIGQNCTSTSGGPAAAFQKSIAGGASYNSPIDGVITHWGVNKVGTSGDSPSTLIIGRETSPGTWTVSAMAPMTLAKEFVVSEHDVRVGIKAGEGIGFMSSNGLGALCSTTNAADTMAYGNNFYTPGTSYVENTAPNYRIPVFATVEPDVDNDGFGDDTQDKCPQSAAFQTACPVLAISQQLAAAKGAIAVTAASSADTSLTATAKVKVPKLGSKKAATVIISSSAIAFSAGQLTKIKLKLPSRVKNALSATKKSKKLKFTVTLSGKGLANTATSVKSISLPGSQK